MKARNKFIFERLITFIVSISLSSLVVFIIPRLIPGNPILSIIARYTEMGTSISAEKLVEDYKRLFGLDKDLFTQYVNFVIQSLQGNFGYSIVQFPTPVFDMIRTGLPWTIGLLATSVIISWMIGTMLGTLVGWKSESSKFSKLFTAVALTFYVIPYYIFAVLFIFLFALIIPIFPSGGAYSIGVIPSFTIEFILDIIKHAALPALSIILSSLGWWFLSMRSMMMVTKDEDFILMAEIKGLKKNTIAWRYAFRNAVLPQFTGLTLSLGQVASGALITEVIFSYPGIGWYLYHSIMTLDYPVIQGCVLLLVFAVCTANLLVDLIYPLLDPRIGYGKS